MEAHHWILLEKPGSVSFRLLLDEMSKVTRLGIVDLALGLDLSDCVERVQ